MALCNQHSGTPQILAQGSDSVYINNLPAARVGDRTICDAKIGAGSSNVFIGGGTETTDAINPEVPELLEHGVLALGLASDFVLASPVIVVAGLVGGIAGGLGGNRARGKLFGEGFDGQKLMAFGGALLGGGLGGKGGKWFDARYEFKTQGLGSNFGSVKIVPKANVVTEPTVAPKPTRAPNGRFVKTSEGARLNRKTEYPSSYRVGVKDAVLDVNTIEGGKHAGKVMTVDGDRVCRDDPKLTIKYNKPVVEYCNEQG